MFDSLHINTVQLPVSTDDRERLEKEVFQTKSLENLMTDVYITEDGFLELDVKKSIFDSQPIRKVRLTDVHGIVLFHATVGEEWFEFGAKFTDGKLVDIKRRTKATPLQIGGSCYWSGELQVTQYRKKK